MNSTLSSYDKHKIRSFLRSREIPSGLGSEQSACSIAAINLALFGHLTDNIPACMSEVAGRWIIPVQDHMPAEMRNSLAWRSMLPEAAGTGRDEADEQKRLGILLDWMFVAVLPRFRGRAARLGCLSELDSLIALRTSDACSVLCKLIQVGHEPEGHA